jgi:hypothetical protein
MNRFEEISLFEKSASQRCILDVEATGAANIENLRADNGYTAENVRFDPERQAFEFGTVPSAIWFNQVIGIQRTYNFRIQARVRLHETGAACQIISCVDGHPKYRGWQVQVSDRIYFSLSLSTTNRIVVGSDRPSAYDEHLIEIVGTYSGTLNVQILYDGVTQPITYSESSLTGSVSYTNACTYIGRFNQWSGWTPAERGCLDTVRDIRVQINGIEVFNVPANDFHPGRIYNRITGQEPAQLRTANRDRCGGLDMWFGSTFLRFSLPSDFDTRDMTFACWCQYSFTEENQELWLFRILDSVGGYFAGYSDLHFYHATGFFKMVIQDSQGQDAPYLYDTVLRSSFNTPVFIGCSRSSSGKYIQWVNNRASKISWQSRPIGRIQNIGTVDLFNLDTTGRRKLSSAWMWNYAFTEADFLNLYKLTKGYIGVM